jgi:hypothetical protein
LVYTLIAISALGSLVWRHPLANATQKAAAPLGAAFTFICLVTGSLWGKPMWGTYWVSDARLTSMLILFLIYLGLLALWRTVARVDKARPSSEKDRSGKGGRDMHPLAKFGLTTVLVTLALLSNVVVTLSALSGANAQIEGRQPDALDWQTFLVPEFETMVEYPAGIFSVPDGKAEKGFGQRFNSADGRTVLTIYTRENEFGDTPASYLDNNLRVRRSALDYERVTRSFFAISSTREGLIFYSRCNFSTDVGGAVHCVDLVYPQAEAHAWEDVVARISRSLRPFEG